VDPIGILHKKESTMTKRKRRSYDPHFKGSFLLILSVQWTKMDLKLMEKLDELFTENPTRGTRWLSQALKKRFGFVAGRTKVRRLLRLS
jgi:hypothetical protein